MRVVILGCGRMGSILANTMSRAGHSVVIIDKSPESFRRLEPGYTGEKVSGMGIDEEVLLRAGIDNADAFIAVTNGDNTNVMAAQVALHRFQVPRVIARVYDPIRAQTYKKFGLEIICTSIIGAGTIRDLILGEKQRTISTYLEMETEIEDLFPQLEIGNIPGATTRREGA